MIHYNCAMRNLQLHVDAIVTKSLRARLNSVIGGNENARTLAAKIETQQRSAVLKQISAQQKGNNNFFCLTRGRIMFSILIYALRL